jgi:hypothetical protein
MVAKRPLLNGLAQQTTNEGIYYYFLLHDKKKLKGLAYSHMGLQKCLMVAHGKVIQQIGLQLFMRSMLSTVTLQMLFL